MFETPNHITVQQHHNVLWDLQGGTTDEYYHLTAAEYSALGSLGALTEGSVLFADAAGAIAENNSKLFWDDGNEALIVGDNALADGTQKLLVHADVDTVRRIDVTNVNAGTGGRAGIIARADIAQGLIDVYSSTNVATVFGISAANAIWFRGVSGPMFFGSSTAQPIYIGNNNAVSLTVDTGGDVTVANDLIVSGVAYISTGSATLPGLAFTGDTDTGIFRPSADVIGFAIGGGSGERARITTGNMEVIALGIRGSGTIGAADVLLYRDSAYVLAQRNSTNSQTFRLYNTYTDSSNYERLTFNYISSSLGFGINVQAGGTGTLRDLSLAVGATNKVYFVFNGTRTAYFQGVSGSRADLKWITDGDSDIGASGANRPRDLYLAGDADIAGTITVDGTNSNAIGGATGAANRGTSFGGDVTAISSVASIIGFNTPTVRSSAAGDYLLGINLNALDFNTTGGTASVAAGLRVTPTNFTNTGGSISIAAGIYIDGPPAIGGANYSLLVNGGVSYFGGAIWAVGGSVSSPEYTFAADTDTGMYRLTTNTLGLATAGTLAFSIDASQESTFTGAVYVKESSGDSVLTVGNSGVSGNHRFMALGAGSGQDYGYYGQSTNQAFATSNTSFGTRLHLGSNAAGTATTFQTIWLMTNGTTALTLNSTQDADFAGDVSVTGVLTVDERTLHGIGGAGNARLGLRLNLTSVVSSASGALANIGGTVTASANNDIMMGFGIGANIDAVTFDTGTFTGLNVYGLNLVGNGLSKTGTGTIAAASTLRINQAPTIGTTNYSILVQQGITYFGHDSGAAPQAQWVNTAAGAWLRLVGANTNIIDSDETLRFRTGGSYTTALDIDTNQDATFAGDVNISGNAALGDAVSDAHTVTGALTITDDSAQALKVIRSSGGDVGRFGGLTAAAGIQITSLNAGETDYEPVAIVGENCVIHYRTGVLTTAAGLTLNNSGNVVVTNDLSVGGDVDVTGDIIVGGVTLTGANITDLTDGGDTTLHQHSAVTAASESSDTTCFPLFVTTTTGNLQPKTNASLTFNASTADLGSRIVSAEQGTSGTYVPTVTKANVNSTAVGNVGTGEDDLMTYSLPANALSATGKGVKIRAWGTFANNANAKTLKLYFGSATLISFSINANNAGVWDIEAIVLKTGSNTQDYFVKYFGSNATSTIYAQGKAEQGTAAQTDTSAITIKCTGQATSNNDITQEGFVIEQLN